MGSKMECMGCYMARWELIRVQAMDMVGFCSCGEKPKYSETWYGWAWKGSEQHRVHRLIHALFEVDQGPGHGHGGLLQLWGQVK